MRQNSGNAGSISLPQGGGAMSGLGEKFKPELFTGTGNFTIPIKIPSGRKDFQPELSLGYSTGNGNGAFGLAGNSAEQMAASFSSLASAASTASSIFSTQASYARREQEWKFAKKLSGQDVRIGRQQVQLTKGSVRITGQERNIAALQTDHAEETATFLQNKNLNTRIKNKFNENSIPT